MGLDSNSMTHLISSWALLKSWTNWQISPNSSWESWSAGSPNLTLRREVQMKSSDIKTRQQSSPWRRFKDASVRAVTLMTQRMKNLIIRSLSNSSCLSSLWYYIRLANLPGGKSKQQQQQLQQVYNENTGPDETLCSVNKHPSFTLVLPNNRLWI